MFLHLDKKNMLSQEWLRDLTGKKGVKDSPGSENYDLNYKKKKK